MQPCGWWMTSSKVWTLVFKNTWHTCTYLVPGPWRVLIHFFHNGTQSVLTSCGFFHFCFILGTWVLVHLEKPCTPVGTGPAHPPLPLPTLSPLVPHPLSCSRGLREALCALCTWGHDPEGSQGRKNSDLAIERPYDRCWSRGVLGCWRGPKLFHSTAFQYLSEHLFNVNFVDKIRKSIFYISSFLLFRELFISLYGSKIPSVIFLWLKNFNISWSTSLVAMNSISIFSGKVFIASSYLKDVFAE